MMIRINLLAVRAVKKREVGRQVVVLIAGVAVIAILLNVAWYLNRNSVSNDLDKRIAETDTRVKELEKVIGEVNNLNKRKKDVEEKLKVLDQLRKGRSGPVRMMDALATATPKKVWIKEFEEKANAVKITGSAFSHDDVAEFMRALGNVVWTSKGMGRMVEQKKDQKTSRVELLANGAIEDVPLSDIGMFFTGIDLKKAEQKDVKSESGGATSLVEFEVDLHCNYAI